MAGVLDRIGQDVEQYLPQAGGVAFHILVEQIVDLYGELLVPQHGLLADHAVHLRDLLGIKIGERTAEVIKIKIGSILPFEDGRERDMIISGQDVYTEQPKEVTIQSEDVRAALQAPIEEMVLHIKDTFKKTTPALASDIIQNGILLTGGGGLLSGLDRYLTDKLEIPVWVSETALTNVVSGCLKVLETPTALKQTLMRSK